MAWVIALDSGPVGGLTPPSPRNAAEADECRYWLFNLRASGAHVILPEIVDYESRREFLRRAAEEALQRLDDLRSLVHIVPIDSEALRLAARLWAEVRRAGRPTADRRALDVDAILAAQAFRYVGGRDTLMVATDNLEHLARFRGLDARPWRAIRRPQPPPRNPSS